jgi:hypothetical protein
MIENCTANINLKVRPSELEELTRRAGGRPITAYLRERLSDVLDPPVLGRRWPENPAERKWKTRT